MSKDSFWCWKISAWNICYNDKLCPGFQWLWLWRRRLSDVFWYWSFPIRLVCISIQHQWWPTSSPYASFCVSVFWLFSQPF